MANGKVQFKWNLKEYKQSARSQLMLRATKAGLALRNQHRKNLNVPYPPASKPGEHPRRRTGRLRDGVLFRQKVREDKRNVTIMVEETTYYWVYLYASGRLTLWDTMLGMKTKLHKIMTTGKLK